MGAFQVSMIYGLLEAVTEWLPISSTGHMILLSRILPLSPTADAALSGLFYSFFEVFVQLGAVLAVPVVYFRRLFPGRGFLALWARVAAATLPCALVGVLVDDFVESHLHSPTVVAVMLIFYGLLFWWVDGRLRRSRGGAPPAPAPRAPKRQGELLDGLSFGGAFRIGLWQTLSLVPGTSRSGATILGGLLTGLEPAAATEFSFILALPAMCGAALLRGAGLAPRLRELTPVCHLCLWGGFCTAFLISLLVVRFLSDFVRRHGFRLFAVYRMVVGAVLLAVIHWF